MSYNILVVCEGPSDFPCIDQLLTRTMRELGDDWMRAEESADVLRTYLIVPGQYESYMRWDRIESGFEQVAHDKKVAKSVSRIGKLPNGFTETTYLFNLRKFLTLWRTNSNLEQPNGVILVRDTENQEHTNSIKLWAESLDRSENIVAGIPHRKIEAWYLSGFHYQATVEEERRITNAQNEAGGVHPCNESHRLLGNAGPRSTKHVLDQLCQGNDLRLVRCLVAPFEHLHEHGKSNGLSEFLACLQNQLVPSLNRGRS